MATLPVQSSINPDREASTKNDLDLHKACVAADEMELERLLQAGASMNLIIGPSTECDYPLNTAARTGSLPLVRILHRHNADIQIGAINDAVERGDTDMLQLLLEPVKAYMVERPSKRRWRGDLARLVCTAIKCGRGNIVNILWAFRSKADHFDELIEEGLVAACLNRDISSVTTFIEMGAKDIGTALKAAAKGKDVTIMQYLLGTLDHRPDQLVDALAAAAAFGHIQSIDLLLAHGAIDPGHALFAAVEANEMPALQHLLQVSAYNPQVLSEALSVAAASGDPESMQLLIDNDAEDTGALRSAAGGRNLPTMRFILATFEQSKEALDTALAVTFSLWALSEDIEDDQQSVLKDTYEPVNMLLEKGAKLSPDSFCQLLECLILQRNFNMTFYVKHLLNHRSRFTSMDELPDDYLLSLTIHHWPDWKDVIKALLDTPVRPTADTQGSEEEADLNSSTRAVHTSTISKRKPDIKIIPAPLIAAILKEDEALYKDLLCRSVSTINTSCAYTPTKQPTSYYAPSPYNPTDLFAPTQHIFGTTPIISTPLLSALQTSNTPLLTLLLQHGANPWHNSAGPSHFASNPPLFRSFVTLALTTPFYSPHARDHYGGRALLHWAAHFNAADLIDDLIRAGADVDIRDTQQRTPLHIAVFAGSVEATKRLCFGGADTSLRDVASEQATPLEWAEQRVERAERGVEGAECWGDGEKWSAIVGFLRQWRDGGLGVLEQEGIRRDYERYVSEKRELRDGEGGGGNVEWFSDVESVCFSDGEDEEVGVEEEDE